MVLNHPVVCFMCPTLRLPASASPLSLALQAKTADRPPCLSTAVCTLVLCRRPLGDLWAAFKTVNRQRNSSRKVSWWSWWARDWWTRCAPRRNTDSPARAFCVRATTCVLYWNSWQWRPRRQLYTSQRNNLFTRLKSLQKNWRNGHCTFESHSTSRSSNSNTFFHLGLFPPSNSANCTLNTDFSK